jgi:hypothetical protein
MKKYDVFLHFAFISTYDLSSTLFTNNRVVLESSLMSFMGSGVWNKIQILQLCSNDIDNNKDTLYRTVVSLAQCRTDVMNCISFRVTRYLTCAALMTLWCFSELRQFTGTCSRFRQWAVPWWISVHSHKSWGGRRYTRRDGGGGGGGPPRSNMSSSKDGKWGECYVYMSVISRHPIFS